MQADSIFDTQLPPLAPEDKDSLLLYLSLSEDPVAAARSANLHYADILVWASRPDIAAYIEQHRTLRTKLHRDAALKYLDHTMRNTRDDTIRCRAAIGILRATDPARFKSRLAQNSNSQPARTKAHAGAAPPAHHSTTQNGHIAAPSSNHPAPNEHADEPAAQARLISGAPQSHCIDHNASIAPNDNHDEDHNLDPDDTPSGPPPGGPRPEPEPPLDQANPPSPTHPANVETPPAEDDIDNDSEDLDEDLDDHLDDDLDEDDENLDEDDEDWDDDDDDDEIVNTRPDPLSTFPDPHSAKPTAATNPDVPEPIPRTDPLPSHPITRNAA